jgi:hypothetical protein
MEQNMGQMKVIKISDLNGSKGAGLLGNGGRDFYLFPSL